MLIEFVAFSGCPHAAAARVRLEAALTDAGLPVTWTEWDTELPETPSRVRAYSSPTVLIDGVDVEGKPPVTGTGCAVGGGPSEVTLRQALSQAIR